mmetsp:Transcript_22371/g.68884  ORF Transcript_22371/g.68884 Transcript_22371/m.68884 type:complete len:881 (+) Transcript_22371:41-2683(+)
MRRMRRPLVRRARRHFRVTLNTSDFPWACAEPMVGSMGHVLPFERSCELARRFKFDAVNLDMTFLEARGPDAVREALGSDLEPGAFRLPVPISDEVDETSFARRLSQFESEAPAVHKAGYAVCAYHLLPFSTKTSFGPHFRSAVRRLKLVAGVLRGSTLRAGLEFIAPYGLRRTQKFDFIHTLEGVRSLIAAADAEDCVGLKFDSYHWFHAGGKLDDLVKLEPRDIAYVELNDFPLHHRDELLEAPELKRELPGRGSDVIDAPALLATLRHVGYDGLVTAEPFSRALQRLPADLAVGLVADSLHDAVAKSKFYCLPAALVGSHPYDPEGQDDFHDLSAQSHASVVVVVPPSLSPTYVPQPRRSSLVQQRASLSTTRRSLATTARDRHPDLESILEGDNPVPPLDVRLDGSSRPPPPLRWGILGCGKIASDFVEALPSEQAVAAVATARDLPRAQQFMADHGAPKKAYGTYAELCADPAVDAVYVATLHPWHREHALLALAHDKHVLVEKPVAHRFEDAAAIFDEARRRNQERATQQKPPLLVAEAMWTATFPAVETAKYLLHDLKLVGDVKYAHADFGILGSDVGPFPADPIFRPDLGGGASLVLGAYVVALVSMLGFPGDTIADVRSFADTAPVGQSHVDLATAGCLRFEPSKGLATFYAGFQAETREEACFVGTKGSLTIHGPAHCPTALTVVEKATRRGGPPKVTTLEYPLPTTDASFLMPNSAGLRYEQQCFARCVQAGRAELPQWSHQDALATSTAISDLKKWQRSRAENLLTHVVSLRFCDDVARPLVDDALAELRALATAVPSVLDATVGPVAVHSDDRQNAKGFTHTAIFRFASEADRDTYLHHPAHKAATSCLADIVDDVFVTDVWGPRSS